MVDVSDVVTPIPAQDAVDPSAAHPQAAPCGRPMRSGTRCTSGVKPYDAACGRHSTEVERAVGAALRKAASEARSAVRDAERAGWNRGWAEGYAAGKKAGRQEVEWERQREQREAERRAAWRTRTREGHQIVKCGRYAYVWRGADELRVGDRVWLPAYYIDAYPTTRDDFDRFVTDTGHHRPEPWPGGEALAAVPWTDAQAYAAWASKSLPTLTQLRRAGVGDEGVVIGHLDEWCVDDHGRPYRLQRREYRNDGPTGFRTVTTVEQMLALLAI